MARALDVLLDKYAAVAEVVLPQALDRIEGVAQLGGAIAHAHADATAAGGALEHHRVTDLFASEQCGVEVFQQFGAFEHGYAMPFGQGACGVLEAEDPQLLRCRADKGDARRFAGFGKGGVLGEKAVAGVDGLGATLPGGVEDLLHHQVRVGGRAIAEAQGLVGLLDMQAGGIGFGVNRDAFDLKGAQGTQDAASNGAAVGDQEFVEHGGRPMQWRAVPSLVVCTAVVHG